MVRAQNRLTVTRRSHRNLPWFDELECRVLFDSYTWWGGDWYNPTSWNERFNWKLGSTGGSHNMLRLRRTMLFSTERE
jgi:hypothetical protein